VNSFDKFMRTARIVLGVGGFILCLPVVAWGLYTSQTEKKPQIFVVNEGTTAAEFSLDGEVQGTIEPKKALAVTVTPGAHKFAAKGGATDTGSITIKDTDFYRGVVVLGNQGKLAVVTKQYGRKNHHDDTIALIPKGATLTDLGAGSRKADDIDSPFPASVKAHKNSLGESVTRICHVNPATIDSDDPEVGCPGF
jgi:hypothetical protein